MNPFEDIVPRQKAVEVIKERKDKRKERKNKRLGKKNTKTLSFGDEAEEAEEELQRGAPSRSKTLHTRAWCAELARVTKPCVPVAACSAVGRQRQEGHGKRARPA